MSDLEVQRDIGRMESELIGLRVSVADMQRDVKALRSAFDEIKGGSRVILAMSAAIGAAISLVVQWLLGRLHP